MPTSIEVYNQILSGYRDLNTELSSLEASTRIDLFELDLTEITPQAANYNFGNNQPMNNGILRIYNDFNLFNVVNNPDGLLKWRNNYYFPFPIQTEGFEYTNAGALPTPKITVNNYSPDQSTNSFYRYIRMQMQSLGDIVGAKFTRIKTFLKYLDGANFVEGYNPFTTQTGIYEIELPRDIYYVDRKNLENKSIVQYTLASILDVENLDLPGRTIFSLKCPWQYRGEGCCYEYNSRKTYLHSGVYAYTLNPEINVSLLQTAPPVATENDQLFVGGIFATGVAGTAGNTAINRLTGILGNSGSWQLNGNYQSGDFIFFEKNGLKYYFVCTNNHLSNPFNSPPNNNFWAADSCAKNLSSCRLRWLKNPAFRPVLWPTNRGGWDLNTFKFILTAGDNIYGTQPYQFSAEFSGNYYTGAGFPRRPGAENPYDSQSHGIPKDANGNYLNGFLPFGGFPGTNQPNV